MRIESLELENFRLHKKTKLEFSDKINYIIGGNGQGKTSILEAIYYLCTTKSFINVKDVESINFEENFFHIKGKFFSKTNHCVEIDFRKEINKKSVFIDNKQIYKATDLIGKFPVVILIHNDKEITKGSPAERRKFVDSVISQSSETYLKFYLDYNKALKQRAVLLRKYKETKSPKIIQQIDLWAETLINIGSQIIIHRIDFINEFNSYVKKSFEKIMGEEEIPEIDYLYKNKNEIVNFLKNEFYKKKEEELGRGKNLVGPQKDDFIFFINKIPIRKYGSQGQHKTFQIALRFGQFFYLKEKTGRTPIFLMDDVFGDLDVFRAGKISSYLKEIGQAFITMTDFSNFKLLKNFENEKIIKIKKGEVIFD